MRSPVRARPRARVVRRAARRGRAPVRTRAARARPTRVLRASRGREPAGRRGRAMEAREGGQGARRWSHGQAAHARPRALRPSAMRRRDGRGGRPARAPSADARASQTHARQPARGDAGGVPRRRIALLARAQRHRAHPRDVRAFNAQRTLGARRRVAHVRRRLFGIARPPRRPSIPGLARHAGVRGVRGVRRRGGLRCARARLHREVRRARGRPAATRGSRPRAADARGGVALRERGTKVQGAQREVRRGHRGRRRVRHGRDGGDGARARGQGPVPDGAPRRREREDR